MAHESTGVPQPLAGCRVLDLSTLLPGPWATGQLAAFGAEVIKIEPPGGDPVRQMNPAMFEQLHRGRQSLVLDLRQATDREALLALVAEADVLVEGMRPGALARQGLDVATLHAANPRLVVASLSGYGWSGPYRDHGGHDLGLLALSGYFAIPSQIDGATARPQVRLADMVAGHYAAFAIVMGWLQARTTGRGCHVDAALFDATCAWTLPMLLGTPPFAHPADLPHIMADSALYRTADGRQLAVATLEDKFWQGFVQAAAEADGAAALAAPAWAQRRGRDADKPALAEALARTIGSRPLAWWQQQLARVDTTVAPVHLRDDALADPQVQARELITHHSDGSASVRHPSLFDGAATPPLPPAPRLDEHGQQWRCAAQAARAPITPTPDA